MERIEKYCYSKQDFKIEWFSGTGPGGQNRNKVQACVRVTHLPSGLKAGCQNHRSRKQNFSEAFQKLGDQLKVWIKDQLHGEMIRRTTSDEVIRTYHHADNRVVDHASGFRMSWDELDKNFDQLIIERKKVKESCD